MRHAGTRSEEAALLPHVHQITKYDPAHRDRRGHVSSVILDEDERSELVALLSGARGALALSGYLDEEPPLFTGELPDADGVLRARWRTAPSPGDAGPLPLAGRP